MFLYFFAKINFAKVLPCHKFLLSMWLIHENIFSRKKFWNIFAKIFCCQKNWYRQQEDKDKKHD